MDFFLILVPILISISHLIGYFTRVRSHDLQEDFHSLSAGLSIGYVFLILYKEIYSSQLSNYEISITLMFISFCIFHFLLASSSKLLKQKVSTEFSEILHLITISVYNFLITYTTLSLLEKDIFSGSVLFLAIILHVVLSEISDHDPHEPIITNIFKFFILTISTLLGALFFFQSDLDVNFTQYFIAFSAGALTYVTIREEIPNKNHGQPIFFLLGSVIIFIISLFINL
jgi:hypothetical protein